MPRIPMSPDEGEIPPNERPPFALKRPSFGPKQVRSLSGIKRGKKFLKCRVSGSKEPIEVLLSPRVDAKGATAEWEKLKGRSPCKT